jgi:putative hemolysin
MSRPSDQGTSQKGGSFSIHFPIADTKEEQAMPKSIVLFFVLSTALILGGCQKKENAAQLPNPASQFCVENGGELSIEESGSGGQFGVCTFQDGKQCEEWALFRGECPMGGVDVSGYITPAGRFCAITGGEYTATANQGTADETGTCTFKNGKTCDASELYKGECRANE